MNRILIIVFLFICPLSIGAQSISVNSFQLLETDHTANTTNTMERDQNGEIAALIKVKTKDTGFVFDGGALGIVRAVQKEGEIWVYVPRGTKKITISHPKHGFLRDYYLSIPVEAAKTYEMVLKTGTANNIIHQERTSQYVVFRLTPPNATVELDGEQLRTVDGMATKMKEFGTYNYRVEAPHYFSEAGNVTVDNPENKHEVNITLKPNFSVVTLVVDDDAEIWVNDEFKGTGSYTGNFNVGSYKIKTRKWEHRSITATLNIKFISEPQTIRLPAPTPIPRANKIITVGDVSFNMVYVEGGTFVMGSSSKGANKNEGPVHKVRLPLFYIGETEVTQELWEAVMDSNPSEFHGKQMPVENVSWDDCQEFLRRLNQMTGLFFRLPTEAEWEYAAQGGNKSQRYTYSGSNNLDDVAWYSGNSNKITHIVKNKQANELGLYDMSGNVWEWCHDGFRNYPSTIKVLTLPTGPTTGAPIIRGGSWNDGNWACRISNRSVCGSNVRRKWGGFRLACSFF